MIQRMVHRLDRLIRWSVMLGCLTLPYTHFNWMPNLGLTRPVSTIFFALAFGLIVLQALADRWLNWRAWLKWPTEWNNWPVLRWWLGLLILGVISAAITPLYGLPKEAFTRLVGYVGIFVTLFIGAYSLAHYKIHNLSRWIVLGYLPVMPYALVEILAVRGVPWAVQWILWFRAEFIVPFHWVGRMCLLATEPSFIGFQILLLGLVLPYISTKWLKWSGWILVLVCLVFTSSGTVMALVAVYLGAWLLFLLKRRLLTRMAIFAVGAGGVSILATWSLPQVQQTLNNLVSAILATNRLTLMSVSFLIRFNYLMNLVYAIIDTRGLGLGIGQYGYYWKEIYLRHINYRQFDVFGEVHRALTVPGDYMKPWSVILGIGVDLGLLGLALLVGFFIQVYRQLAEPRHRALFFACLLGLAGAYPLVTPHIWLALMLMAGMGVEAKLEKGQA